MQLVTPVMRTVLELNRPGTSTAQIVEFHPIRTIDDKLTASAHGSAARKRSSTQVVWLFYGPATIFCSFLNVMLYDYIVLKCVISFINLIKVACRYLAPDFSKELTQRNSMALTEITLISKWFQHNYTHSEVRAANLSSETCIRFCQRWFANRPLVP